MDIVLQDIRVPVKMEFASFSCLELLPGPLGEFRGPGAKEDDEAP